uniref:Galectin n=1 Tax=Panagrellus redivivus TaxID=6233 RepID=A0A7E4UTA2_PANRE
MNWPQLLTVVCLITTVNGQDPEPIPPLNDHACPRAAWLPEGDGFRYEEGQKSNVVPKKTFMGGHEYQYIYQHNLNYGQTLYFEGNLAFDNNRFEMNIIATSPPHVDDAVRIFHFKLLSDTNRFALNTFNNGWGDEEHCPIPTGFVRSERFNLKFHVTEESFKITMNGASPFCEYKHRLPANIYCFINILGKVEMITMRAGAPMIATPYKTQLPNNGLGLRDRIFLGCVATGSFEINFSNIKGELTMQCGFDFDGKRIYCIDYYDGRSHETQFGDGFPLKTEWEFELDFIPDGSGLVLSINNQYYKNFKRESDNPKEDYVNIQIEKAVSVYDFQVCPHARSP